MEAPQIVVREVWQSNLGAEFSLIQHCLGRFPYASLDTEFPGTIYNLPKNLISSLHPSQFYSIMKQNVDALNLIQLGLTLSDAHGNLPHFGTKLQYVWQFNFCDFDSDRDLHNPESISLLKRQGIDFTKNKLMGIDSHTFARMFKISGLRNMTWVTFHGVYDFGYLIKILNGGRQLPNNLRDFMMLVQVYFGKWVYDLKPMARLFGLHGGLDRVAECLKLERVAGKTHQAGSDSLLTMQVFMEMTKNCFSDQTMSQFNYKLHGLTVIC